MCREEREALLMEFGVCFFEVALPREQIFHVSIRIVSPGIELTRMFQTQLEAVMLPWSNLSYGK
jgi:hypothetical protein